MDKKMRKAFEKWFNADVHNDKSLKILGMRTMLWSAYQIAWNARDKCKN